MRRRDFITPDRRRRGPCRSHARAPERARCGASACSWPKAVNDAEGQARLAAFLQEILKSLGLDRKVRNVRIEYRWGGGDMGIGIRRGRGGTRRALAPDVILAARRPSHEPPLQQATRTVPIVFAVARRSGRRRLRRQPGAAGRQRHRFHDFEFSMSGKWLELLKRDRAGRDAGGGPAGCRRRLRHSASLRVIQAVAPSLGVEVSPVNVRDAGEIERAVAAFARSAEWRPDRDGRAPLRYASSRSDRHAGGAAQAARGLLRSRLRRRRRPDLLWA